MNRQISLFEGEVKISLLFLNLSPTCRREDFGVLCVPAILFTEWVLPKSTNLVTGAFRKSIPDPSCQEPWHKPWAMGKPCSTWYGRYFQRTLWVNAEFYRKTTYITLSQQFCLRIMKLLEKVDCVFFKEIFLLERSSSVYRRSVIQQVSCRA